MFMRISTLCMAISLFFATQAHTNEVDLGQQKRLQSTIMNQNIPLEKRMAALKVLYRDIMRDGKIQRKFCVWDILGKNGPVYATVADQQFRSLHYGLELTLEAYQDEAVLMDDLKSGLCDAGLISGARALELNRFTGSIEALGAVPSLVHLQTIFTVLSNPKMAKRMTEGNYVVLGVASLGENYLYSQSQNLIALPQFKSKKIAVPSYDLSLQALVEQMKANLAPNTLLGAVDQYASGQTDAMLAPIIGYHIGGSGKVKAGYGIVNAPLSQSTIQLIGRAERFPLGVAQLLREDFLLKTDNYVQRVEKERANIPSERWFYVSDEKKGELDAQLRELRLSLRDQGVYDAEMLKLAKKVRCRVTPEQSECKDGRE